MRAILIENEVMRFNGNLGELQQFMFEASGGRLCGFNVTIEAAEASSELKYLSYCNQMYRLPNNPNSMNIYHIEYSVYRNIDNIAPEYSQYMRFPGRYTHSEHKLSLFPGDVLVWTGIDFSIFDKARIIIDNKKSIKNE